MSTILKKIKACLQNLENSNDDASFLRELGFLRSENEYYQSLYQAIKKTILTNPSSINDFINDNLDNIQDNLVIWLAKVKYKDTSKYVWVISILSKNHQKIKSSIMSGFDIWSKNPLTECKQLPPFIIYLDRLAQSQWQKNIFKIKM